MAKKIVDETLKFDIIINGDKAKKEYGQLTRENRKLLDANKDLEEQAKKLEKANRESSEEYTRLKKQIQENMRVVEQNEARLKDLTQEIGISNLSMRQLAKEAGRLKGVLGNLDPNSEDWQKFNKELQSVRGRQANLRAEMGATSSAMGGFKKSLKDLVFPVSGAMLFTDLLQKGIGFVKEYAAEAVQLSIESKGVEFAFKRLGDQGESAFRRVKAATHGLLSDLDIKKSLVEFDNFNISLEESNTLFEFLAVRSAQTGRHIDDLKDSLVEGLSKESKLRIDNLGISTAQLNAELEKTPNFVQAVANIAKTEIAEAGNILTEASSSSQRWNATLENTQRKIGDLIVKSGFVSWLQEVGTATLESVFPTRTLREEFEAQAESFLELQKNLTPLVDEYEDLTSKAALNKEEQARLKKVIGEVASIVPSAITQFDEYGNAIDISAEKAREFIEVQKSLLKYKNQEAINQQKSDLEDYRRELDNVTAALNKRNAAGNLIREQRTVNMGGGSVSEIELSNEEISKLQARAAELQNTIQAVGQSIDELSGDALDKYVEREKAKRQAALEEAQARAKELGLSYENLTTEEINALVKKEERLQEARKENAKKFQEQHLKDQQVFEKEKQRISNEIALKGEQDELKRRELKVLQDSQAKRDEIEALKLTAEEKQKALLLIEEEQDMAMAEIQNQREALELKRIQDFEARKKALLDELELANKETDLEKEIFKAEMDAEKHRMELDRLQLNEEEKAELLELLKEKEVRVLEGIEEKHRKKTLADEAKNNEKLIEQRKKLQDQIIAGAADLVGRETRLGQALLAIKGIFAAKETLLQLGVLQSKVTLNTAAATADIAAGTAATAKIGFPQNIPMLIGFAAQVAGIISAIKGATSAGKKVTTPSVQGFEEGLYPVLRNDGKRFAARYGGNPSTQVVPVPTHFIAGEAKPEMIIDGDTFRRMDPAVTDYILALAGKRTAGFEGGFYPGSRSNDDLMAAINATISALNERLAYPIEAVTRYGPDASRRQQEYDEKIRTIRDNAKIRKNAV